MTLLDVCKLIKHYIKPFIAIIVICTLVGLFAGYMKVQLNDSEYSSEAVLTISEPTGTVDAEELMPIVQAVAANVLVEDAFMDSDVSFKYDLPSRTISFTAVGPTEEESVFLANAAARRTAELTDSMLTALAAEYMPNGSDARESFLAEAVDGDSDVSRALALEAVAFTMNDAADASSKDGGKDIFKFGIVGLFGGLFLAICMVLIIDLAKAPIRGREEIEKAFEIPVLVDGSDVDPGKRLWANVQFMCDDIPSSVCLVPIEESETEGLEEQFAAAIKDDAVSGGAGPDTVKLSACKPLSKDVDAAYAAHDADVTVVVAKPWKDSMKQLTATLQELSLAQANVAGIALVSTK